MNALASITQLKSESSERLQCLHDQFARRREASRILDLPVETWDQWFIFFAARGMDSSTRCDRERKVNQRAGSATYKKLITFLQESGRTQKTIDLSRSTEQRQSDRQGDSERRHARSRGTQSQPKTRRVLAITNHESACPACGGKHLVDQCGKFKQLTIPERRQIIRNAQLCFNCLSQGHFSRDCTPRPLCAMCSQPHHTLMHTDEPPKRKASLGQSDGCSSNKQPHTSVTEAAKHLTGGENSSKWPVLLVSAVVLIRRWNGSLLRARVLVDPGSEVNLATRKIADHAGYAQTRTTVLLADVGGDVFETAETSTTFKILSRQGDGPTLTIPALLLKRLGL